jgi:glutamine synthetase type III
MGTLEILKTPDAVRTLTVDKNVFITEKTNVLARQTMEQRARLKRAADKALFDYTNDKTLTDLTLLDGEDFVETR